jgi:glycosyltransferase involved in cell wall biosynthesis
VELSAVKIGYLMQQAPEIRRPPFDGPASHVREVITELVRRGHEVPVVARMDGAVWGSPDLVRFEPVSAGRMEAGPRRWAERALRRAQRQLRLPYLNWFESARFAEACSQELRGCDVLYERFSWVGFGGRLAARRLGIPHVIEYNGDPLHDLEAKGIAPGGLQRKLSVGLSRAALRGAVHVVASGEGWRRQAIDRWGLDPDRVSVVENGTGLLQVASRNELRAFKPDDGAAREIGLVYLGGFLPWHGISVLLRAFARAREKGARLRLWLIGSGDGMSDARQVLASSGLNGSVVMTGALTLAEYAPLLAGADIGLSPYCGWKEYAGLKLYDYKAAGLAVIASGEAGQPSTLEHGRTGWIVPPCDEGALCDAMVRLASDSALRRRLGREARLEAEASHGWDQTARRLESVFDRVVSHAV